jgi:hypothetical protein
VNQWFRCGERGEWREEERGQEKAAKRSVTEKWDVLVQRLHILSLIFLSRKSEMGSASSNLPGLLNCFDGLEDVLFPDTSQIRQVGAFESLDRFVKLATPGEDAGDALEGGVFVGGSDSGSSGDDGVVGFEGLCIVLKVVFAVLCGQQ